MIKAKRISKIYGFGENKNDVLKGIDLQISDGDFAVILGASGSGKSTLLNCLSGLERVDGGSIEYDGLNIPSDFIYRVCGRYAVSIRTAAPDGVGSVFGHRQCTGIQFRF